MSRLLIKNASVLDGTGGEAYPADILISDDKISGILSPGHISETDAHIIEAFGKTITPGFIDIHRHCDYAAFKPGFGEIELAQGITSTITGSCGLTPYPRNINFESGLDALLAPCLGEKPEDVDFTNYNTYDGAIRKIPLPINVGGLIGSCAARIAVKGFEKSAFSHDELVRVKHYINEAMDSGAFGLSMGLMYIPEFYGSREELTAIASTIADYGGLLTCHMRGEGDGLVNSVAEILEISDRAGVRLEISHFKSCGAKNWGAEIYKAIELIEKAKNRGQEIGVDFYPYTGGATTLLSLIPPAYMKETLGGTLDFMSTPAGIAALRESLRTDHGSWDNYVKSLGWERIVISIVYNEGNQKYIGRSVAQITSDDGFSDECECVCKLLTDERGKVGIIVMSMDASDVDAIASLPYSAVISDALYAEGGSHPRQRGAFPRIIRDFVNDRKILTLSRAINKMTSMPARIMGISERGLIKEGYKADLNIFEPRRITDCAGYENPLALSTGMDYVLVNGRIAYRGGNITARDAGKRLRKGRE